MLGENLIALGMGDASAASLTRVLTGAEGSSAVLVTGECAVLVTGECAVLVTGECAVLLFALAVECG